MNSSTAQRTAFRPGAVRLGLRRSTLELKQFFRGRESVFFSFALPVLLLVVFGALFSDEVAPGVRYTQYFASGMIAVAQYMNGFQTLAMQIPVERDRGVLKRLAGTPMPPVAYFIGKVAMVYLIGVAEMVLLLAIAVACYDFELPAGLGRWLTLVWVTLLGIAAVTLCGIAYSSVPREGKRAPAVVAPVGLVLQFISGVYFVFTDMPGWMQYVGAVFPLKWMAQGMRAVFLPDSFARYEAAGGWELGRVAIVLSAWVVGGLILCLSTFRWTAREDR